jgi:hypothetical protein
VQNFVLFTDWFFLHCDFQLVWLAWPSFYRVAKSMKTLGDQFPNSLP